MKKLKKNIASRLKRLAIKLEEKPKDNVDQTPINSLAPKILTKLEDIKRIQPYLDNLKQAIETTDINNIALTGKYGSGKSTILKTFQHINDQFVYLNISLASFKESTPKPGDEDFERRLEVSILQQMFYHVNPKSIPDSRFKRIINIKPRVLVVYACLFVVWLLSALVLLKFEYINNLNPNTWNASYAFSWTTLFSSLLFFTGIGLFAKSIYQLLKNSKVNKVNIKGEIELEAKDKSAFNQHLEEILYFFERTKFNVVIIEDIDRFKSTDIFTKLREINTLINHSTQIGRPVKFVYAVKDELFTDQGHRVKFFEFIIPVIPFINSSNASEQLSTLISEANLNDVLSSNILEDLVSFIDDIDMRLLINIFHEYQVYKTIQEDNPLHQDSLFAIIVYKNLYPEDFGNLQKRKGDLYNFFANKPNYLSELVSKQKRRIEEIDSDILEIENELEISIKELRIIYLHSLASTITNFHSFYINESVLISDIAANDDKFRIIQTSNPVEYCYYEGDGNYTTRVKVSAPKPSKTTFSSIESSLSNKSYNHRQRLLSGKSNNRIKVLKEERDECNTIIKDITSMSVQELFERIDIEKNIGTFKDNNLVRTLLLNGYINEHYNDYINLFHGVSLTKKDNAFEQAVKSSRILPNDYKLTKTDVLVKHLSDHHFKKEAILNYDLLQFLLSNEANHRIKLDYFFRLLKKDGEKQFSFILGFIKNNNLIEPFIEKLCAYKSSLWQYTNQKSGISEMETLELLKQIFSYGKQEHIWNFDNIETLAEYISKIPSFFTFCSSLNQTNTIQSFIAAHGVRINALDIPNENQKNLFQGICNGELYALNLHNVRVVLQANNVEIENNDLETKHYSILLEKAPKFLLEYIDENIDDYFKEVLLPIKSNIDETEDTIVYVLNNDSIDGERRIQFVLKQKTNVTSLASIEELKFKTILLNENKVSPNWENISDYFTETKLEEFNHDLISFLNSSINFKALSNQRLDKISSWSDDHVERISSLLIHSNDLSEIAYDNLVSCVPYEYDYITYNKLDRSKLNILVNKNKLVLNKENYEALKDLGGNEHLKLIESKQGDFVSNFSDYVLNPTDLATLLKSKAMAIKNKLDIVERLDVKTIADNQNLATIILEVIPRDKSLALSAQYISALISAIPIVKDKVSFLNLYNDRLDDNQTTELVLKLRGNYPEIFKTKHRPTFEYFEENLILFENLKKRKLILKYEFFANTKVIRVFALHQKS